MISVRTLGNVQLSLDGEPAPRPLTWRKNLALIVYLARSPDQRRSREHLIGLLWGESPDSAARHSLNEALRVVRRYAWDGAIRSEADQIALNAGAVTLDVAELESRLASGDWEGAADLASGEFMEGFSVRGCSRFEDWLTAERTLWRDRSVEAHVRHAERALARGRLDEARTAADRATRLDPLSDAAARALIQAIALSGERAGALAAYDSFQQQLAESLGVEPDLATTRLADRVRRERTWQLPPAMVEAPHGRRTTPLIGREDELERALTVWRKATAVGQPAVLMIEGDPGMGRTRLAEEIVARARLEGTTVAGIRAVAADRQTAWSGVLGFLRGGLVEAPGVGVASPAALAAAAACDTEWRERFGDETAGVESAPIGRALSDIARAASEEQPLLLFADDAENLDQETALALEATIRDLDQHPFGWLLSTTRHGSSQHLDALRARVGREIDGAVIGLKPLSRVEIEALARQILPSFKEDEVERISRRIEADSASIPLLAVELMHAVRLGLELGEGERGWPEPRKTLDQTLPGELPDPVVAAIRIGYRRLSPVAQRTLAAASVLEERVTPARLELATGLKADEITQALDELEWERWLATEPRGYGFVARIVRQVIARDMLTDGQRQRLLDAVRDAT